MEAILLPLARAVASVIQPTTHVWFAAQVRGCEVCDFGHASLMLSAAQWAWSRALCAERLTKLGYGRCLQKRLATAVGPHAMHAWVDGIQPHAPIQQASERSSIPMFDLPLTGAACTAWHAGRGRPHGGPVPCGAHGAPALPQVSGGGGARTGCPFGASWQLRGSCTACWSRFFSREG